MRFGRWSEILAAPEPDPRFPLARALRRYARAVAFAAQGQLEEARIERDRFGEARSLVPEAWTFGKNKAADLLGVAEHVMNGEILYREGHEREAFAALREAVRRQDLLRYSEPPDWILPVRHALGAALMQSRRFAEAEQVYRDDLVRLPHNGWSLFGLTRALELQDKQAEAEQVRARWEETWRDCRRPALLVLFLPAGTLNDLNVPRRTGHLTALCECIKKSVAQAVAYGSQPG